MLRLSASNIQNFKDCPMRFYFNDILGLQPIEEKDSLRVGKVWHKICEIINIEPGSNCPYCLQHAPEITNYDPDCYWCGGTGKLPNDMMDVVIRYLDKIYTKVPNNKTYDEWIIERTILLYSLIGYKWYYTNQIYKRWGSEIKLEIPVNNTTILVARIDEIVTDIETGEHYIRERKSTSSEIDGSSDYWDQIGMDTQISTYLHTCVGQKGLPPIKNVLYDVWHKPRIKSKKLTQGDSKKFVETGEYCGQKFKIYILENCLETVGPQSGIRINDKPAIIESGKKEGTFAIYETPEMFGARLLEDITNRPEYYFQCREIGRTDKQMKKFEQQLQNLSKVIQGFKVKDLWYCDERSCKNRFKCDYTEVCWNDVEIDIKNPPDGFKIYRRKENE